MYSSNNSVTITDAYSDITSTKLSVAYSNQDSGVITLSDMIVDPSTSLSTFNTFENVSVSSTNPGYIKIENEIISYEGVSGNTLTNITRQVDQTPKFSYTVGTPVFKYELDGISLRRINKTHSLDDVGFTTVRSKDLDYYYIKIDPSTSGIDRSVGTSFPLLYIKETKSTGGSNVYATQNIPFEIVRPNLQTLILTGTSISASVKTVSGTSVDGTETSFANKGFEQIALDQNNYLSSPRIVASHVNETTNLGSLPGNKSFTLNLNLSTNNSNISPVIDLDRVNMIFASNRINNAISNYATDSRTSSLIEDPSAFVYATNSIALEVPASSIKLVAAAYVNRDSDLRAFYAIMKDPNETPVYYPFPGYINLNGIGEVINVSASDGSSDKLIVKSDNYNFLSEDLDFVDYEFTRNNLPDFRYFSIKLIGSSTNMANPPRVKDLRVIALA